MKRGPVITAAFLLATTALSSLTPARAEGASGLTQGRYESQDGGSLRDLLGARLQDSGDLRDAVRDRLEQRQALRELILDKLERRNELRRLFAERMGGNESYSGFESSCGHGGYDRQGLRDRILDRLERRQALRDLILDKLERRIQLRNLLADRLENGGETYGSGDSYGYGEGLGSVRDRILDRIEQREALRDLVLDRLERRNQLRSLLLDNLEGRGDELRETVSGRNGGGEGLGREDILDLILDRVRNNPQAEQAINRLRDRIGGRS